MLAKLEYLRDRLNTSFWLVPGSMTLAAIAAAPGMLWLETTPFGTEIGRWLAPCAVGACIEHLAAALALALEKGLPSSLLHDDLGRLRVDLYSLTFGDLADAAFNPIRQDGRDNVAVSIRLLESLTMLVPCAHAPVEREVLRRHGSLIAGDALEQIDNEKGRRDLEARAGALQDALEREAARVS